MALELQRPTGVRIRLARAANRRRRDSLRLAIASLVRIALVGVAIGIFLVTGSGAASIAFVGVIALGAALFAWDR